MTDDEKWLLCEALGIMGGPAKNRFPWNDASALWNDRPYLVDYLTIADFKHWEKTGTQWSYR